MKNLTNRSAAPLTVLAVFSALLFSNTVVTADEHVHHQGANVPIGIMGDHLMDEGEWMVSYRMMNMAMEGNRDGTDRVTLNPADFMVTPLKMKMNMHMFGGMLGIKNNITIMAMTSYIKADMDHEVIAGGLTGTLFTAETSGLGDTKISVNWDNESSGFLLNAGLSLPTGSIDKTDVNPASGGNSVQMPYPMQLGSGTFDLLLGVTKTGFINHMNWGAQGKTTIRTGSNDHGYQLGNELTLTTWLGKTITDNVAWSIRLNAISWGNIKGADPLLVPGPTVPTKQSDLRGGARVDAIIGFDTTIDNQVLGLEIGVPIHQNLDGPQLETDATITLGWQVRY